MSHALRGSGSPADGRVRPAPLFCYLWDKQLWYPLEKTNNDHQSLCVCDKIPFPQKKPKGKRGVHPAVFSATAASSSTKSIRAIDVLLYASVTKMSTLILYSEMPQCSPIAERIVPMQPVRPCSPTVCPPPTWCSMKNNTARGLISNSHTPPHPIDRDGCTVDDQASTTSTTPEIEQQSRKMITPPRQSPILSCTPPQHFPTILLYCFSAR